MKEDSQPKVKIRKKVLRVSKRPDREGSQIKKNNKNEKNILRKADSENNRYDGLTITDAIDKDAIDNLLHISKLSELSLDELISIGSKYGITYEGSIKRQDLMHTILRSQISNGGKIIADGTLEILPDGYGFLRSKISNYLPGSDDIYISPSQIRLFALRTGDVISGEVRPPKDNERFFALLRIDTVNDDSADNSFKRVFFEHLTPVFPNERFNLEFSPSKIATRVINLVSPIGKGQRGLIVAPPKAGKTMILQEVANAIGINYPDVKLFILLIDERPEEVTDMARHVRAEVVSSTFDEPPEKHVQVSEMVLEKAKRLVEKGHDVVIMLDSITKLARAYNLVVPASGKILTGGVDSNALHKPKRFFGAARNIEDGGSLTVIATALVDTGSRMDEYIYEEFKGTGNMELHLERRLANKRVFPAININNSSTRREELLLTEDEINKMWAFRKFIQNSMDESEVMELVIDKMNSTKDNLSFLKLMNG